MEKQNELLLQLLKYTALGYTIIIDECCYYCPLEDLRISYIKEKEKIIVLE